MSNREAFEAWFESEGGKIGSLSYQLAFAAWQAALAAQQNAEPDIQLGMRLYPAAGAFKAQQKDRCNWTQDEEGHWDTTCGNRHTIIDGTPADNHMKYCCYCGLKLAQASYQGDSDE